MLVGQWISGTSLSAGYLCTEMLSMATSTLFPNAETVFRRHVPPAQVPLLKNSAFDLMTRPALIGQVPTEPNQSTNRPDA